MDKTNKNGATRAPKLNQNSRCKGRKYTNKVDKEKTWLSKSCRKEWRVEQQGLQSAVKHERKRPPNKQ